MTKARFQLLTLAMMLSTFSVLVLRATAQDAAKAAEASDPATWKTLLEGQDLQEILNVQSEEIEKAVKAKGTFTRGLPAMIRAGHSVALVGNIAIMRTEGENAKKAAALRDAGLKLASIAAEKSGALEKYDEAKAAAAVIKGFPDKTEPTGDGKAADFKAVVPLEVLMKCVSSIDVAAAAAKRAKDKKAFAKSAKELEARTKLLACLAVVAREHKSETDWKGWCDDLRKGAIDLSAQFAKKDQEGVDAAYKAMQKSCTECHDVYRKE